LMCSRCPLSSTTTFPLSGSLPHTPHRLRAFYPRKPEILASPSSWILLLTVQSPYVKIAEIMPSCCFPSRLVDCVSGSQGELHSQDWSLRSIRSQGCGHQFRHCGDSRRLRSHLPFSLLLPSAYCKDIFQPTYPHAASSLGTSCRLHHGWHALLAFSFSLLIGPPSALIGLHSDSVLPHPPPYQP
jgi:hypothetical protein